MVHNSNEFCTNSKTSGDNFITAVGKAAEEEMLRECELWEREAGNIRIPEMVESKILALANGLESGYSFNLKFYDLYGTV